MIPLYPLTLLLSTTIRSPLCTCILPMYFPRMCLSHPPLNFQGLDQACNTVGNQLMLEEWMHQLVFLRQPQLACKAAVSTPFKLVFPCPIFLLCFWKNNFFHPSMSSIFLGSVYWLNQQMNGWKWCWDIIFIYFSFIFFWYNSIGSRISLSSS